MNLQKSSLIQKELDNADMDLLGSESVEKKNE